MKKFLFILSLTSVTSLFANTASVYRFDDIDSVIANGKTISVEDLRDGFASVNGVQVNEDTVSVKEQSKLTIIFRNPTPNKFGISTMGAKIGGDGGGG